MTDEELDLLKRKARAFEWLCERGVTATWDGGFEGVFLYECSNPLERIEAKMRERVEEVRELNEQAQKRREAK